MPDEDPSDRTDPRLNDLAEGVWEESARLETVLVVHGYPSLREALVRTLVHYGYRAVEAPDREQALRIVLGERIDLVLLDIDLHGGEGVALAAELAARPETRHVPVVGLSSEVIPRDAPQLGSFRLALGMPVEQKDLLAALDRCLNAGRSQGGGRLKLESSDEQCHLPLEDRLRCDHLSLFFRFPVSSRIELRPDSEPRIHALTARLAALAIHPEITVEGGGLLLQYELTIADALTLGIAEEAMDQLFSSLVAAFPELSVRPEELRRRLVTLEAEYRRLQRVAS